ncbi:MAG TPA: SPOR domain-containing protein [Methylomirabilota bacterium]
MRRVKSDVSHRIRRQPSIFSVRWFRIALGVGVALVLALLVGPSVASWFGGDLPGSLFLLVPWSASERTASTPAPEPSAQPSPPTPPASSPGPMRGTTAAGKAPAAPAESPPPRTATAGAPPPTAAPPAATKPPRESGSTPADGALPRPGSLAAPPAVYWVQVGAFLDHKNADRLAERLKGDGLAAATTSFEQSRVLYRVLLGGGEGGRVTDESVERVRGLGHPVEATADGPAVTGLVPLRKAVETSHRLKQQGIPVRLKQEVSSSTFRVVRVGSFATVTEAEATLAALNAKGVEGVVVRER